MSLASLFKSARKVSTPLMTIKTPDQAVTITTILEAMRNGKEQPLLTWDCVRGCQWLNDAGLAVAWKVIAKKTTPAPRADELDRFRSELGKVTINIVNMLEVAAGLPEDSVFIVQNAQFSWDKAPTVQAAWNLRDPFKSNHRTLVMLTDMGATTPAGLRDALPLTEELPTVEEVGAIIDEQFQAVGLGTKAPEPVRTQAIDAVIGLSAYVAEESIALSFEKKPDEKVSLNIDAAWKRKCDQISAVRGLKVKRGGPTFKQVGGNAHIIQFFTDLFAGDDPPRVLVLLDEFEKMLGGTGEGSDGEHKSELIGSFLTEMETREYEGLIEFGVPGASKTYVAAAAAATFNRPLLFMSIPDIQEKWVGSSNENFNSVMQTIYSASQGRAFFIRHVQSYGQHHWPTPPPFLLG